MYDWLKPIFASVVIIAGRVNASAKKTVSGNSARTSAISHSQNGTDFVCGLSTRNARTPCRHQCIDHVLERLPEPRPVLGVEVDVVDVLVALGRVLGVLERAVGSPVEPLRMLRQPGVVGRGLDREVERDLEPGLPRRGDERVEVLQRPELGMDRVVAALLAADRPRAAGIALRRGQRVVPALAVRLADRVDRRQVDDVEAELGQLRQHLLHALEAAPAAREELVPGAEPRADALDVDLERLGERRLPVPVLRPLLRRGRTPRIRVAGAEERLRLGELAGELGLAGGELAVELVEQGRVAVDPGLDRELPAAEPLRLEAAGPAVVAERLERRLEPCCANPPPGSGRRRGGCRGRP